MAITPESYRSARASLVESARKLRNWRKAEPERATFISGHLHTVRLQLADLRRWPRVAAFVYDRSALGCPPENT